MKRFNRIFVFLAYASACFVGTILAQEQITPPTSSGGSVPAGMILFVASGSCPAGYVEALDGFMLRGTTNARGDVGTTAGADSITPTVAALTAAAQTISGSTATEAAHTHSVTSNVAQNVFTQPTLAWPAGVPTNATGAFTQGAISWPAGVPTFTGTPFSSVINHTHTITVTSLVQGGTTAATTGTHIMTSTAVGGSARAPTSGDSFTATEANPAGGVSSITPGGTNAWPAGVPTIAAGVFTQPTVSWPAGVPTASGGSVSLTNNAVASGAGSAHSHAVGTLANASSAVTGTLSAFNNRPAYTNVIFCQKS